METLHRTGYLNIPDLRRTGNFKHYIFPGINLMESGQLLIKLAQLADQDASIKPSIESHCGHNVFSIVCHELNSFHGWNPDELVKVICQYIELEKDPWKVLTETDYLNLARMPIVDAIRGIASGELFFHNVRIGTVGLSKSDFNRLRSLGLCRDELIRGNGSRAGDGLVYARLSWYWEELWESLNRPENSDGWSWLISGKVSKIEARLLGCETPVVRSERGPGRPKGSLNKTRKNTGEKREVKNEME